MRKIIIFCIFFPLYFWGTKIVWYFNNKNAKLCLVRENFEKKKIKKKIKRKKIQN